MNRNCECRLSNVAKDYVSAFHNILDAMIQNMTNAELSDSISYNFIVQMIPHHRAAIEMSRNLLKYTTFVPLQDMAIQIVNEQTKSIEDMRRVICACGKLDNCRQDVRCYQAQVEQIMNTMFSEMENACATNQLNATFMREMLPHHRGAVEMSELALQYRICPELVPILNAIIHSQKQEIRQMQQLLRCMRC